MPAWGHTPMRSHPHGSSAALWLWPPSHSWAWTPLPYFLSVVLPTWEILFGWDRVAFVMGLINSTMSSSTIAALLWFLFTFLLILCEFNIIHPNPIHLSIPSDHPQPLQLPPKEKASCCGNCSVSQGPFSCAAQSRCRAQSPKCCSLWGQGQLSCLSLVARGGGRGKGVPSSSCLKPLTPIGHMTCWLISETYLLVPWIFFLCLTWKQKLLAFLE